MKKFFSGLLENPSNTPSETSYLRDHAHHRPASPPNIARVDSITFKAFLITGADSDARNTTCQELIRQNPDLPVAVIHDYERSQYSYRFIKDKNAALETTLILADQKLTPVFTQAYIKQIAKECVLNVSSKPKRSIP